MTWTSQTLADSLPAVFSGAQTALESAQKELAAVDAAIARLQTAANVAQQQSDNADQLINDLSGDAASSGIFHLKLSAGQGLWNERILNATGAPPQNPNAYSAIVCSLSLTADLSSAQSAKDSLETAVSTPLLPPSPTVKLPSISPPPAPELPDLPEPNSPPEDEWTGATVADLFPGARNAVSSSVESIKKESSKTIDGLAKMQQKKAELQQAVDDAQALVDSLGGTGVYAFSALPEVTPSADWYDRMITPSEAEGRPPFDPSLYSSGTVTVVVATSYAQLLERFGKIQSILSTSL